MDIRLANIADIDEIADLGRRKVAATVASP